MGQGPPATPVYAHAPRDDATGDWEPLADHLAAVGAAAERFGAAFGWGAVAGLAGRLHDIGKCSAEFQAYLAGTGASGGDHSGAGALEVLKLGLGPQVGHALAAVIAGHHAGLADGGDLVERLGRGVPAYTGWRAHSGPPPSPAALAPARMLRMSPERGFTGAFLTRMLFSCLVDADSIETARFYGEGERRPFADVAALRDRLDAHLDALAGVAPPTALNALRAEVLAHARSRAELPPGLFTLTVPTGGGKTLTALSFALRHAARHGLRRVVAVISLRGRGSKPRSPAGGRTRRPSPLRGGVDRNGPRTCRRIPAHWSPLRGGVDRNNLYVGTDDEDNGSPPRGGVDRNQVLTKRAARMRRRPLAGSWVETRKRCRPWTGSSRPPSRGRGSDPLRHRHAGTPAGGRPVAGCR